MEQITKGDHDETEAAISPDGTKIAYISSAHKDPDRTLNTGVLVIDAKPGAAPRKLTDFHGPDRGRLSWSPDSRQIAYLQGSESKYSAYSMSRLAVVSADGGPVKVLTEKFDRGVSQQVFSEDGKSINVLVADDRLEYPAKVSLDTGDLDCGMKEQVAVTAISSRKGHVAVLASSDAAPPEIFAFENNNLRKLTNQNDALISDWRSVRLKTSASKALMEPRYTVWSLDLPPTKPAQRFLRYCGSTADQTGKMLITST